MNRIYVNLKRFDIPAELGGLNRIAPIREWGGHIVNRSQRALRNYAGDSKFTIFFPESHLIGALDTLEPDSPLTVGCQSVHREDTAPGGNFGAFTTSRTANAMKALGCTAAIIGHCEERKDKAGILAEAGVESAGAVNRLLGGEIRRAVAAGLEVLYCIGEKAEEQNRWQETLRAQLETGLDGVDTANICVAYEPVWAIGPGKTPPDAAYIQKIARFVGEVTGGLPVVYGGGLKAENAAEIAGIPEVSGGLIALTRFAGEIGFYPEEYLEIVRIYLQARKGDRR